MRKWVNEILKDSEGNFSSKRAISIIAFMLISGAFLLNLFMDFTIDEFMWDGMITLVIFGIGFVASEKFSGILSPNGTRRRRRRRPHYDPYDPYDPYPREDSESPREEPATDGEDYENTRFEEPIYKQKKIK